MRTRPASHPLLMMFCWFLTVFLVLFPKGGFKIGTLPITWGYLFLGLTLPFVVVVRMLALPLKLPVRLLWVLVMLAPIQALTLYAFLVYGISELPFAIGNAVALFLLPAVFLLVYAPFLHWVDGERLSRYLRWSILLAAIWGIILFLLHPVTGRYIEVPYLTINAADYGELETTKHIARGLFFKLIATYNNGNLYGVATLILFPLYSLLEKVRWRRITVRIAILLTLSRTVWVGLILYELFPILLQLGRQWRTFPVLHLDRAGRKLAALALTALLVMGALLFNHAGGGWLQFLFDPSLGGRTDEIGTIHAIGLLPTEGVRGFGEVVYISALQTLGYFGLFACILLFASPVLLLLVDSSALESPARRAALKGLVLYALLALLDGGFDYIPMMAFYWFAYTIYLFGWPRLSPRVTEPPRHHAVPLPMSSPALG